jgi:hypothetical protein
MLLLGMDALHLDLGGSRMAEAKACNETSFFHFTFSNYLNTLVAASEIPR